MKAGADRRNALLWLVAMLVLGAGYYIANVRYQAAIGRSDDAARALNARTAANDRVVAQAARLRDVQTRVQRDLASAGYGRPNARATSEMLHLLLGSAWRNRMTIESIDPAGSVADGPPPKPPAAVSLGGTAVTIHVRGTFRDIVRSVATLTRRHVLIEVLNTQIARSNQAVPAGSTPSLDASISAVLYRSMPARSTRGEAHAPLSR